MGWSDSAATKLATGYYHWKHERISMEFGSLDSQPPPLPQKRVGGAGPGSSQGIPKCNGLIYVVSRAMCDVSTLGN